MYIEDEWVVLGGLDKNAFLISLQGVANVRAPNLYFIYPKSWPFTYTASVFDYYKYNRNYTFRELKTPEQALEKFKESVNGYVVWDKNVHDRVFAIGPEVMVYVPFLRVKCQLRHQCEFSAKDRSQGAITNISFTILF